MTVENLSARIGALLDAHMSSDEVVTDLLGRMSNGDKAELAGRYLAGRITEVRRERSRRAENGVRGRERAVLAREATAAGFTSITAYNNSQRQRQLQQNLDVASEFGIYLYVADAEIALGNGERVTWRDATVADHERRVTYLQRNIEAQQGNVDLHVGLIERLRRNGLNTLGEALAQTQAA
jgi:hypothetical protein